MKFENDWGTDVKNLNRYRCSDGDNGCGNVLAQQDFRFYKTDTGYFSWSSICKRCEHRIADYFNIPIDIVDIAISVARNEKSYFWKIPGADRIPRAERVRILLLASGVEFPGPSEAEILRAEKMRGKFQNLEFYPIQQQD